MKINGYEIRPGANLSDAELEMLELIKEAFDNASFCTGPGDEFCYMCESLSKDEWCWYCRAEAVINKMEGRE